MSACDLSSLAPHDRSVEDKTLLCRANGPLVACQPIAATAMAYGLLFDGQSRDHVGGSGALYAGTRRQHARLGADGLLRLR